MFNYFKVAPRDESKPLCQLDWELHFEHKGHMIDKEALFDKIFRGGVDPHIRPEVWKYLLGYYQPDMTHEERQELRKKKVRAPCYST